MRPIRFWLKIIMFFLPFAVIFLLLTGWLLYVGESLPLGMVAALQQQRDDVLYRPQYGNRDQQFKALSVNLRRPEVLALGSSRILQFRAAFFDKNPDMFYNAAAPAWRLPQVAHLLQSLDQDALPRVLLLAIDPPWFNADYAGDEFPRELTDAENIFLADRSFAQDVLTGSNFAAQGIDLGLYLRRAEPGGSGGLALGLRAIRDGHGFRSDGSEQYGDFLIAKFLHPSFMLENHLNWMRQGEQMYVYGDTVSETALAELTALLDFAAANDITVIGFLPSYAPDLWQRMLRRGNHRYIEALTPRLRDVFAARNMPFFDFSDGLSVDTSDAEFFDGWHASELSNLRLYLKLLNALPDVLGRYSDAAALTAIVAQAHDTWRVFNLDGSVAQPP